jgi:8-oxo-dGTP diphosphatase
VVAGVITDARGRILLTRRTEGRDLAGRWEFPGGKREPGETSEQALVRELEEELGIRAEVGDWIIDVPQRYPDKRLRLEVRRIRGFKGTPRGHEGQAMLWVMPDKLDRYDMPPADKPVVGALLQPDRLLITPRPEAAGDAAWLASLERALKSGVRRVLLRLPETDDAHRQALGGQGVALCKRHGAQALVHDDASLAMTLGAGLHLSGEQLMKLADRPVGAEVLLAVSADGVETLGAAEKMCCDFAVIEVSGADAARVDRKSPDWSAFEQLREVTSLPLYVAGIGGAIDVDEIRRHGGHGIAMTGASWGAGE